MSQGVYVYSVYLDDDRMWLGPCSNIIGPYPRVNGMCGFGVVIVRIWIGPTEPNLYSICVYFVRSFVCADMATRTPSFPTTGRSPHPLLVLVGAVVTDLNFLSLRIGNRKTKKEEKGNELKKF